MKNIVVMPAFSETGQYQPFYYNTKRSWEHWCKLNNADFYSITEPIAPFSSIPPQIQKMWLLDILEANDIDFDQIALVDYDTFALPHCPNFFEMSDHKFCAVLDWGEAYQINRSIQMCKTNWWKNSTRINYDTYFNSGFIVFNKSHGPALKAVQEFDRNNRQNWMAVNKSPDFTDDQTLLNFVTEELGMELKYFPRSFNALSPFWNNVFFDGNDSLGRTIRRKDTIRQTVNIFHFCGDNNFRNQATDILVKEFL